MVTTVAGHLLDLRLDVRFIFSHGFNSVMYTWAQMSGDSQGELHKVGIMLLQRLVSQYKVLLSNKHAGLASSSKLARPLKVAAVWSLIVGEAYFSACRAAPSLCIGQVELWLYFHCSTVTP